MTLHSACRLALVLSIPISPLLCAASDPNPFVGRWALDLPAGIGWLEVREEAGYLDGDLLWRWGSVQPVASMLMDGEALVFTRTRTVVRHQGSAQHPGRSHVVTDGFFLQPNANGLTGFASIANRDATAYERIEISATRLPPLPVPPNLKEIRFGEAIHLFNGRDLVGWRLLSPNARDGWKAIDGALVNVGPLSQGTAAGRFGNIRTEEEFGDFHLSCEVNVPPDSNSGIFLRGDYEVQILDSYGEPPNSHHMGAIYSRITPAVAAEKEPGHWQRFDIFLVDRHVTVILNGTTVIDNAPLLGVTGGALRSTGLEPGPIYLQGDHGPVAFRHLLLRPVSAH